MTTGTALELNIPSTTARREELLKIINDSDTTPLENDLFERIKLHCLHDMTDVFERLRVSNPKINEMAEKLNNQILNDSRKQVER